VNLSEKGVRPPPFKGSDPFFGQSIDAVGASLPAYGQTASRMTQTARLLAWLMAAIVGLHGVYLMASVRLGRRYSV